MNHDMQSSPGGRAGVLLSRFFVKPLSRQPAGTAKRRQLAERSLPPRSA